MALTVRERLRNLRTPNSFGQHFVSFHKLDNILDDNVVHDILCSCEIKAYERDEIQQKILKGGKRTFAALCTIGRENLIVRFSGNDNFLDVTLDSKLPLEENSLQRIIPDDYRAFYDIQFEFTAPIFRPNQHHRSLHDRCILPFTKVQHIGEGGYGEVSRIEVAGCHQGLLQDQAAKVVVVRKELRLSGITQQDYEHEQHILSLLRCLQHSNIIQFYAAYTLRGVPTLLFAPADCNLADFLTKSRPQPGFDNDLAVLIALYGLSSAIAHIHNYFSETINVRMIGCHYDLKPKNVLVTPGRFILADFGLSRLKPESESSRSGFKAGISDYAGPECQDLVDDFEKHRIGRRSDIWSLGCILAEVATHLALGPEGVKVFSERRRIRLQGFLTIRPFHAATEPSKHVFEWLAALECQPTVTESRRGLLTLIRTMLAFEPNDRPECLGVSTCLFLLAQRERVAGIEADLEVLSPKAEYGLRVELIRFRTWSEALGIRDGSESGELISWLLSKTTDAFETISNALEGVCAEVVAQAELLKLDPIEPLNRPTYYVLRKQIDTLWNALPTEEVLKLTHSVETVLLREQDLDSISMEGLAKSYRGTGRRAQLLLAMQQALTSINERKGDDPHYFIKNPIKMDGQLSGKEMGIIEADQGERQVLVELLEYDDKWIDRFDELVHRVDSLVSLLSNPDLQTLFPSLRCINFCHLVNRQAFGLLFELPRSTSEPSVTLKPITLVDLISQTQRREKRPLLEDVFALAHTVASSVAEIHRASWMHKGLSAYNLIFFPEPSQPLATAISRPYLIGFNHSRQSNDLAFTEGTVESVEMRDYQHPEYRDGGANIRFREKFDYYSVGIILLELGLWKPLKKLTRGKEELSSAQLQHHILQEQVPLLGSYVGKLYQAAVQSCLDGSLSRRACGGGGLEVREEFQTNVVRSLSRYLSLGHRDNLN